MPYFNSSAIKRGEYDAASQRLTLWFPEGRSYTYCRARLPTADQGVCEKGWQNACTNPLPGRFSLVIAFPG